MAAGDVLGRPAPENAGQVIRPLKGPGHCQHHVADFPAQGGAAVGGLPADEALQGDLVCRFPVLESKGGGKHENQQVALPVTAQVVGAHLACHAQEGPFLQKRGFQQSLRGHNGQGVHRRGQAGYVQIKTEKNIAEGSRHFQTIEKIAQTKNEVGIATIKASHASAVG